jgi:hypothetical protein
MLKKRISVFAASLAILAIVAPSLAMAHSDDNNREHRRGLFDLRLEDRKEKRVEVKAESKNEFGVHVFGEKENNGKHKGWAKRMLGKHMFYNGTVTATSDTGFTMETHKGDLVTVNASNAKIVEVPNTEISLGDIELGDTVHITGTKEGSTITATAVYNLSENLKPAMAKGTVTAVNDNTITVETKDDKTITVNVDDETKVVTEDTKDGSIADIETGATVKMFGLWDTVVNIFTALTLKTW